MTSSCTPVANATPTIVQNVNAVYLLNPCQFVQIALTYGIQFTPVDLGSSSEEGSSSSSSVNIAPTQGYEVGYYKNLAYETAQLVATIPESIVEPCLTQLYNEPKLVQSLLQYYKIAKVLPAIVDSIQPKVLVIGGNNRVSNIPGVVKKYMYVE